MSKTIAKLDQALKDLVEAYSAIHEEFSEEHEDDDEGYQNAMIEALENAIEGAIDDADLDASIVAMLLSHCSEALENLDPEAFAAQEEEDADYTLDESGYTDDEELDDEDLEDLGDDEE